MMLKASWTCCFAVAFVICLGSACNHDPYEKSADVTISVSHPRIALGASGQLMIDVAAGSFLQSPKRPTVDSIEVEGDGKIRIEEPDETTTLVSFDTLEPGRVKIRVNVSQDIDGMFGTSTREIYNTFEFQVVEVGNLLLSDPCVEDGVVLSRLYSPNGRYSYGLEIEDPDGRPLGGDDYQHGWVRDLAGATMIAPIKFVQGNGHISWSAHQLEPGPITVGSEFYGFDLDTELHDPGEVNRLELGTVETSSGHFYDLPFRLFIDDSQLCEQPTNMGVTGRVLTPEVCTFSGSHTAESIESIDRSQFRFWRLQDGVCRVEVIVPWANGDEGIEKIVEFPVRELADE